VPVVVETEAARAARRAGIDLDGLAESAVDHVSRRIALPETVVSILARPGRVVPETGVGGFADPVSGEVFVYVDPGRERLNRVLAKWVEPAIAHELHHAARILDGPGYGRSVVEAIVTEGLADVFALDTYGRRAPWTRALGVRSVCRWWARARERSRSRGDYDHSAWFFGTGRALPRWAGYTIGYVLVRRYLSSHPSRTAADLVVTPAPRIVAGARLCGRRGRF
jgi:uncharacterized protein YjaZ